MNYDLKEVCRDLRCDILQSIGHLGVGHIGGCLSVTELLAVLYFSQMNIDPANPQMPGRDRFICSKGHAGPAVYAALANRGYFDRALLLTLCGAWAQTSGGTHAGRPQVLGRSHAMLRIDVTGRSYGSSSMIVKRGPQFVQLMNG